MTSHPDYPTPGPTDEAWREIDDLLETVAGLAESDLTPTEFYAELMDRIVPALAATGGAVWTGGPAGGVELQYQVNLPGGLLSEDREGARRHARLVEQVLATGKGKLSPPQSGTADSDQAANPTELALVLCPWSFEDVSGVVEVFQRPGASPSAQQGCLRFLSAICELVADFHRNRQLRGFRRRIEQLGRFEQFTERVHRTLDPTSTAYEIANEGRRLIGCDRLSVAVLQRHRWRVLAISGVDGVNRRANAVRHLERLAKAVTTVGEPVWFDGSAGDLAPEIEESLSVCVDEFHARALVVVPLAAPQGGEPPDEQKHREPPKMVGALVVEQFRGGLDERLRAGVDAIRNHSASALANAMEYESGPVVRFLRAVGKVGWMVSVKHVGKTAAALVALAAVVIALATVPADFQVEAHGELQPLGRRHVFAPSDGVVSELEVAHADRVEADQVLLVMRRPELDFEFKRVWGELQTARKKLAAVEAERLQNRRETADERRQYGRLTAREEELREETASFEKQYEILEVQQGTLTVRSPTDGEVLTCDRWQLLEARPVNRGQLLMTVADLGGPWVLEIRVPDDRVAHVLGAQREIGEGLDVSFVPAADPGRKLQGKIDRVGIRTEVSETEDAFVLATVRINRDEIPELIPGGSVVAKIHCGRRAVGYVWFHDLWEAIQTWVLF